MIYNKETEYTATAELNETDYKTLFRLSRLMTTLKCLDQLFNEVILECKQLFNADRVTLFLIDRENKEVYTKVSTNTEERQIRMMLGRGIPGAVIFTGELLNLDGESSEFPYNGFVDGNAITSALAAPLTSGNGEVVGVLQACNKQGGRFDKRDEALLTMLCEMLAQAHDCNARHLEQQKLSEKLVHQATHDPLTGLPNRYMVENNLDNWLENARTTNKKLAILFIDLDHFKLINDSLGHSIGDGLLKQVAYRLKSRVRFKDLVARQGGDEFLVILNEISNIRQVEKISRQLLSAMQQPFFVDGQELYISASIGSSLFPDHGSSSYELLGKADRAMYRVKEKGKNDFHLFEKDVSHNEQRRLWLVTQLHKALEYGEFELYFQPQLDLRYNRIAGAEALIRWRHHELGMVSPGEFIPLAEETGLIVPIGNWVIEEACRQALEWQKKGYPPVKVSVNVSALQFKRENFVEGILGILKLTGLDPHLLELELTEGMLLGDIETTVNRLKGLKDLGVRLAIDDFGTGYSSLQYLKQLPVDTLKIDRYFVKDVDTLNQVKNKSKALLDAIITLGRNLEMKVLAEGVETREQMKYLIRAGCEEIQGFYHSKPLNVKDFEEYLDYQNQPDVMSV